ncbi:MAG TPA: phosphoadenylyl-sulfate reductase [Burkholderiales bacterium]
MSLEQKIEHVRGVLASAQRDFAPLAFANSFGLEDMVLTDVIVREFPGIEIFTLDTGRLPEETYDLMKRVADHYGVRLRVFYPDTGALERHVNQHGPNAFYDSVELRKECCHIRKVEPLKRALRGKRAWLTGLRREQAVTRRDLPVSEFDQATGLQKFNPLADWSHLDVWTYVQARGVPYNALHERGYPSIGCAPCTRAVEEGEDIRAGRWWWEDPAGKECGLHRAANGVLKRAVSSAADPT